MTTRALHERADGLRAARTPFVHARVVLAERPTSAKPGDDAIVLADGTIEGFVGGQCSQATLRQQALVVLERGEPMLLRIAPTPEPDQPGKTVVHNACLSGGTLEIFMEPVLPAPVMRVIGTAPVAGALHTVGAALGWEVEDWKPDALEQVDAVVVASHGFDEEVALAEAARAGVPYIGLVASPKRAAAVLASLDLSDLERAAIKAPAGLDLGSRTPEEIALSIYAEIIERRRAPQRVAASAGLSLSPAGPPAGAAIDPICRMTVAAVPASIHAEVDGVTWYFCCEGCKTTFLADPSAYASAS